MYGDHKNSLIFYIGLILLIIIILSSIFAPIVAPYDRDYRAPIKIFEDGSRLYPPYTASTDHWLGTDQIGRDLLTKLLYGARYTLTIIILTAIFRLLLALPIGLYTGWKDGRLSYIAEYFSKVWISFPLVILAMFLTGKAIYSDESVIYKIIFQMVVLIIIGIPSLSHTIQLQVNQIKKSPFIEGAKVLGGSDWHLLRKHVFPHLKPHLLVIWVMEIIQTLWILGQLAIVNIIVGGSEVVNDLGILERVPATEEWTGILALSRYTVISKPSLILGPLFAYSLTIMAFVFISEGLKHKLDKQLTSYELE